MTIQRQDNSRLTQVEKQQSDQALHPASQPKKISVNNPLVYFLILFGVVFRPDKLKAYRTRLNSTEKLHLDKQAGRLATTLMWLPVLSIFALIWVTGLIALNTETAVLMFVVSSMCAYGTYKYGLTNSVETKNNLLLGSMFSIFGLMAVLFTGIYTSKAYGDVAILLSLIILIFALISLTVSMVFKLETLDILSGFIALFIVGGVSMTMSQVMNQIWLPVIVIMVSVLWVGITEERHDLNNNHQHQAQR